MNAPRVLHISFSDYRGGADIAARRIFEATRLAGVEARLGVRHARTPNSDANQVPIEGWRQALINASMTIGARVQKSSNPFHRSLNVIPTGGMSIPDFSPDLVHLHWVGSNTLSLKEIQQIPVPIVWTLHDSWAFAGAEHHPSYPSDTRFVDGYRRGNRVHSSRVDVDGWVWRMKKRAWDRPFTLVAPSRWMAEQASHSLLMRDPCIETIPNPVPVKATIDFDRRSERQRRGIPLDAFLLVVAGMGGTGIHSKGWPVLREALRILTSQGKDLHLLMIGQDEPPVDLPSGVGTTTTGVLQDAMAVSRAMSCADTFITTSTIESFGLVAAEASALGLPVVAPAATGLLDVVVEGETGWLFEPGHAAALAGAISEVMNDPNEAHRRGRAGRGRAERLWSMKSVGEQYRGVYERVLAGTEGT